eukprot:11115-Heterococcus_DN1.PRE.2
MTTDLMTLMTKHALRSLRRFAAIHAQSSTFQSWLAIDESALGSYDSPLRVSYAATAIVTV